MAKKNLLIINRDQFGYHIDTFYYAKHLGDKFDITYIGLDNKKTPITVAGIYEMQIPWVSSRLLRFYGLIKATVVTVLKIRYDIVFIRYFPGVSLLSLLPCNKLILDIRTGSVVDSPRRRFINDFIIKMECKLFRNISVISRSLGDRLGLHNYNILPLGGQSFSECNNIRTGLHLLYVGTLTYRKIEDTILGVKRFNDKYKDKTQVTYTIVGDGLHGEKAILQRLVENLDLQDVVTFAGYVRQEELPSYYEGANIGVSYVPVTSYFDCQPPTKTYEYLLSGLITIATGTAENKRIINGQNGVIINDDHVSFCRGLEEIYISMNTFNRAIIRNAAEKYKWENIINNYLAPLFE